MVMICFLSGPNSGSTRISSAHSGLQTHCTILHSNKAIKGRKTLLGYSTMSSLSWPSMYTLFFTLMCLHPSKTSHRRAVHSDSPSLSANLTDGRICSLRARRNSLRVTSPVGTVDRCTLTATCTCSSFSKEQPPPKPHFSSAICLNS